MKLFARKNKFSVTEKRSVAIRIVHEFCVAMGILRNAAYNFELTEPGQGLIDVRVELVNLPKPNHLCFRLQHCLTAWKIMRDSFIILNLPERMEQNFSSENLKEGENKFRVSLATRREDNALTFMEEK